MWTSRLLLVAVAAIWGGGGGARAHMVLTYPGTRGNNLHTNGTPPGLDPTTIGVDFYANGSYGFPYGMQWIYPCGGLPQTTNRTKWPYQGGALSIQPGWFQGHSRAFMYVNIGIPEPGGLAPPNMSHNVVPAFAITGPNNSEYGGQFCLPQVPMPVNVSLQIGDNITIQVVEAAQHGAALYACVDVTLADPKDVEPVTPQNCYNSTDIRFQQVFMSEALTAAGGRSSSVPSVLVIFSAMALATGLYALL